jgi:hypothetical protein
MRKTTAALLLLMLGTVLRAELTVEAYKKNIGSKDPAVVALARTYVLGLGEGMRTANVALGRNAPRLFCPPEKLALGPENFLDVLDQAIGDLSAQMSKADLASRDISVVLLRGMADTFPCK